MAPPLPRRLPRLPLHLQAAKHFRTNALQPRNAGVEGVAASGAGVAQAQVTAENAARVETVVNRWADEVVISWVGWSLVFMRNP